jgi:sugar phosphate isomerase/epimerase
MKLGIRFGYGSKDDFRSKVKLWSRCGIETVELGPEAVAYGTAELKAILHDAGLAVSAIVGSLQLLNPERSRRDAGVALDLERLEICRELGASGLIEVPIFGANPYPDLSPVADRWELERELLVAQGKRLAPQAEKLGVNLLLEPLNRYETHFLNRVEQAVDIVQRIGSPAVKIMPDLFHMNIEEADIPAALHRGGACVGYVHLADSTRLQPGSGHTDFPSAFRALKAIGYDGHLVMECGFDGDLETSVRRAVGLLREEWAAA